MIIQGTVMSGLGRGAGFLELPWVRQQLAELMSEPAYPGTLNLRVEAKARSRVFEMRQSFFRIADPADPACPGYVVEATIATRRRVVESAYLILPERTIYEDVLELISPVRLRDAMELADGDRVELTVRISEPNQ